jgi:aspartyl-tRNA(Asn)/glutamyl-tRNA(Gln) amidotransferase subunit C
MRLSREEVEHVALLARLELTDAEREQFTTQLNSILEHFQVLTELDTSGIEPTSHVIPLQSVLRDDEVRPSLPAEEVMANAPDRLAETFRVPRIVE